MHGKPEVVDPYLKLGLNVQLDHQVAHELPLFELGANLCLYFVFGVDGRKINLFPFNFFSCDNTIPKDCFSIIAIVLKWTLYGRALYQV